MIDGTSALPRRLGRFVRERFPLATHLPMALAFSFANMSIGRVAGSGRDELSFSLAAFSLALLFFFRLRCFDELKDIDDDTAVNPDRPLARGLVSPREVRWVIVLTIVIEVSIVVVFAVPALPAYALALAFSLLMYKEFFMRRIIRPHLTTYAVMHTFVAVLLGIAVAAVAERAALGSFSSALWLFGVINWAIFNVFEFARKTFAREEERADVETYSSIFSPVGAVMLSASQVAVVVVATWMLPRSIVMWAQVGLALMIVVSMLYYLATRTARGARFYRTVAGVYIVAAYVAFAAVGI